MYCVQGRNRHIFLRGQSHFSWFFSQCEMLFFPVETSHFGRPKTNFCRFQKWKQKQTNKQPKKKKKKKRSSPLFITFPTSISNFPPPLLQFSFFSSQFSPLFLASYFPIRQQKFPGQKSRGGGTLLPVTPLIVCVLSEVGEPLGIQNHWDVELGYRPICRGCKPSVKSEFSLCGGVCVITQTDG